MAIICLRALHRTKYPRWRRAYSCLAPLLFALLPMPDNDSSATTDDGLYGSAHACKGNLSDPPRFSPPSAKTPPPAARPTGREWNGASLKAFCVIYSAFNATFLRFITKETQQMNFESSIFRDICAIPLLRKMILPRWKVTRQYRSS